MERLFFALGAMSAFIGVSMGAFAAHGLKGRLEPEMLLTFEVGARYQMYHALALFVVAWAQTRWAGSLANAAGWFFVLGTILFSGSLYALSISGTRWLGAITPFGGLAFLSGWICLAALAVTRK